jgi:hypothetical protein
MNADGGPRRRKLWRLKLKTNGNENFSNASPPSGKSWQYIRRAKRTTLCQLRRRLHLVCLGYSGGEAAKAG